MRTFASDNARGTGAGSGSRSTPLVGSPWDRVSAGGVRGDPGEREVLAPPAAPPGDRQTHPWRLLPDVGADSSVGVKPREVGPSVAPTAYSHRP
ncbi:hypothetical protein GCM10010174_02860 [Kutzneria viridogrisea]|uniref:Uncharacterized protein n=1 Tax=Kutzneria viridogrisea TaxID=47990 RepID=A0ABR6BV95_9PSEU|nr:hypothetical protein [Kutzneria viridogrisea]MBA8930489.1 hypothetical protein [Kutzneria viridogrisea]